MKDKVKNLSTLAGDKNGTESGPESGAKVGTKKSEKLFQLIDQKIIDSSIKKSELSKILGYSTNYIHQLRNSDEKQLKNVSDDFVNAVAQFLNVPKIFVLVACHKVELNDFYQLSRSEYEQEIEQAIRYIFNDKNLGMIVSDEILNADFKVKELIVHLYQQSTQKVLIKNKVDLKDLLS